MRTAASIRDKGFSKAPKLKYLSFEFEILPYEGADAGAADKIGDESRVGRAGGGSPGGGQALLDALPAGEEDDVARAVAEQDGRQAAVVLAQAEVAQRCEGVGRVSEPGVVLAILHYDLKWIQT